MPLPPYHIFGSATSVDVDLVFFVNQLGSIQENLERSKAYGAEVRQELRLSDAHLNGNLATVHNGVITAVYKGTADELNNSVRRTYLFHEQQHDLLLTQDLPRDKDLKYRRTLHKLLSHFTRTELRSTVKTALRSEPTEQLKVLQNHDWLALELPTGKQQDVWKVILFSVAQCMALHVDIELYTKAEVSALFPKLRPIMQRDAGDHDSTIRMYLEDFGLMLEDRWC